MSIWRSMFGRFTPAKLQFNPHRRVFPSGFSRKKVAAVAAGGPFSTCRRCGVAENRYLCNRTINSVRDETSTPDGGRALVRRRCVRPAVGLGRDAGAEIRRPRRCAGHAARQYDGRPGEVARGRAARFVAAFRGAAGQGERHDQHHADDRTGAHSRRLSCGWKAISAPTWPH